MNVQIIVLDRAKDVKHVFNIRPVAKAWQFDRMSVILEIRDLKTNRCLEVWHFHIEHATGKILHKDKKYSQDKHK